MYIYNFFNSLNLLKNTVDTSRLPRGNYLYFGVQKSNTLIENDVALEGNNNYYLIYAEYTNLSNLYSIPVDVFYDYIKKLESELIDLNSIDNKELNPALFEAVWLINELSYLENIPFLNAKLDIEVATLISLIDYNGGEYNHGIDYFDNINLLKRIHLAQIRYFICQYLKSKLKVGGTSKEIDLDNFDKTILNAMNKFVITGPDKYKVELYTEISNPEFDDIIEQIAVLTNKENNVRISRDE